MEMVISGSSSYWSWACCLKNIIGQKVSKQAIFSRMNAAWVNTVKALVQEVIAQHAVKQVKHKLFKQFKNVWLQDSTCLHLPEILYEKFRGKIMDGQKKSVAKLNIIVNALSGHCAFMEWGSFSVSEFSLSKHILDIAKAGELVIRDLGYFSLPSFRTLDEHGIYFLTRLRYGICLFDIKSNKPIELLKMLKGKHHVDKYILCGNDERFKVRLVAIKLPYQQAEERRRKAKKHHRKTTKHSKEYYALLDYLFFISNVGDEIWDYEELSEAYRIRWNVEILFKSWKSGLKIKDMIPDAQTKTERVESILYLLLLYISWFQIRIYEPLLKILRDKGKFLSIIKAAMFAKAHSLDWLTGKITVRMKKEIEYYCCYDIRPGRTNAGLRLEHFLTFLT